MTKELLKKYNIKAKKSLGQNFLINEKILEDISNIININGKNIIEVGPGYGALTEKLLLKKPKSLNLVELDKDMIDILNLRIKSGDFDLEGVDFNINKIDVLKFEPKDLSQPFEKTSPQPSPLEEREQEKYEYFLIANIPYYITSPILRHFLYNVKYKPEKMIILMQKDVGDKILGQGKNKSSVISLFIEKKCKVKEVLFVGKENFIPSPKVESSVLLFEKYDLYNEVEDEKFLKLIKAGFSSPRKLLIKNFVHFGLEKNSILDIFKRLSLSKTIRGEDLNIASWCELIKYINI